MKVFPMKLWALPLLFPLRLAAAPLFVLAVALPTPTLVAQQCTMQAQLPADDYGAASATALAAATAIQKGDSSATRSAATTDYAANFTAAESLIAGLAPKLAGDTLAVKQVFELDATNRRAGDAGVAEFICTPPASATEVDFSIPSLPPGTYIFAMVEASGAKPWLLSMLLKREAGAWKLAGFYPHTRAAAGKDGLFYWRTARADAKDKKPWLAWLDFSAADFLLRPANFLSSSHLDELHAEQRAAAPPELSEGIGPQTPLVLKGAGAAGTLEGADVRVTGLYAEPSDDASQLNIVLHVQADALPDAQAERARNFSAARALVDAHPELRKDFGAVLVITEVSGQNPFVTESAMATIR